MTEPINFSRLASVDSIVVNLQGGQCKAKGSVCRATASPEALAAFPHLEAWLAQEAKCSQEQLQSTQGSFPHWLVRFVRLFAPLSIAKHFGITLAS